MSDYRLFFDGACLPNPGGTASFGFALCNAEVVVDQGYGIIGKGQYMSDVYAEYYALNSGLASFVRHLSGPSTLQVFGDSKFVVAQVNAGPNGGKKKHKVRPENKIRRAVETQLRRIKSLGVQCTIDWIPREQNFFCDSLAKKLRAIASVVDAV